MEDKMEHLLVFLFLFPFFFTFFFSYLLLRSFFHFLSFSLHFYSLFLSNSSFSFYLSIFRHFVLSDRLLFILHSERKDHSTFPPIVLWLDLLTTEETGYIQGPTMMMNVITSKQHCVCVCGSAGCYNIE